MTVHSRLDLKLIASRGELGTPLKVIRPYIALTLDEYSLGIISWHLLPTPPHTNWGTSSLNKLRDQRARLGKGSGERGRKCPTPAKPLSLSMAIDQMAGRWNAQAGSSGSGLALPTSKELGVHEVQHPISGTDQKATEQSQSC